MHFRRAEIDEGSGSLGELVSAIHRGGIAILGEFAFASFANGVKTGAGLRREILSI